MSTEHHTNFDNIAKIILIGDTGSGKSTLVNYLYNYFHKGDLNDLKVAIPCRYHPVATGEYPSDELNLYDNTQSKTNTCIQYMFTDSTTDKQYLFVDTPGLSDTRGNEQNEINMNKIIDAITQLGNLTTVMIVINGSISRLNTCLRSVIACLNENIPDIILENVIVILTNVKKYESPFDLRMLNLHGKVYPFYMQNNAFVSDPQIWTKFIRDELEHDWNHSMNQIKFILQTIDSFKQISINAFIQMKHIRNDIKFIIHQVHLELLQIQKIQYQLSQLDSAIKQADQDILTYQDYIQVQNIEIIQLIDAPYHSTLCANCNEVCHDNCHLNETKLHGSQIFARCSVMNNGRCQQCRNHCSYLNHYHAKKTIHVTYETLYDLLADLKDKYDQAYENRTNYQEKILTKSEAKKLIEKVLKQKLNELKTKTMDLYRICSSINLAQELKYLIEQLKIETNLFENLETKLQSEQVIKSLTKFMRLTEENQEKDRRKRSTMQIIDKSSSMDNKSIDIHLLKNIDLVELHKKTTDRTLLNSISEELYRRVQGKSTDPLSTSNEIMTINRYLEKYKQKSIPDLSYSYRKLQKQINDILNSNILRIVDVTPDILIENFIVYTLLDEKENTGNIQQDTPIVETTLKSLSLSDLFPAPIYPPPYPTNASSKSANFNSFPIGISHILSAPYPSSNEPSVLPALPSDYSPIQTPDRQQSKTVFRLEDYRYDSSGTQSSKSSIDHQDFIPMPMPILMNPHHSNINLSSDNIVGSQHRLSSNGRPSKPDVIPSNNDLFTSSKS